MGCCGNHVVQAPLLSKPPKEGKRGTEALGGLLAPHLGRLTISDGCPWSSRRPREPDGRSRGLWSAGQDGQRSCGGGVEVRPRLRCWRKELPRGSWRHGVQGPPGEVEPPHDPATPLQGTDWRLENTHPHGHESTHSSAVPATRHPPAVRLHTRVPWSHQRRTQTLATVGRTWRRCSVWLTPEASVRFCSRKTPRTGGPRRTGPWATEAGQWASCGRLRVFQGEGQGEGCK